MHWPARPSSSMSTIHVCRRSPRSRTLGWRHESRGRKGRILVEDYTDLGLGQETTTRASRIVRSSRHGNAAADANQRQIPSNWKLRNARKGRCQRRVSWVHCGEILAPLIAPRTRPGLHGSTGPSLQQGTSSTVSFDCRSRGERGGGQPGERVLVPATLTVMLVSKVLLSARNAQAPRVLFCWGILINWPGRS